MGSGQGGEGIGGHLLQGGAHNSKEAEPVMASAGRPASETPCVGEGQGQSVLPLPVDQLKSWKTLKILARKILARI